MIGSDGDKFYIILEGTVSVIIPHPEVKDVVDQIEESKNNIDEVREQLREVQEQID